MFQQINVEFEQNLFHELYYAQLLENVGNGRQIANLCITDSNQIPIVRTTTKYKQPIQYASTVHKKVIDKINMQCNIRINNIMLECYDNSYKTMKYHSDQSTDLEPGSNIVIFSCYENKDEKRTLHIKNKTTNDLFGFIMQHNSAIIFNTTTNRNHIHKIVRNHESNGRWIGMTMRYSSIFVLYTPIPFIGSIELRMCNNDEEKEYYKLRSVENKEIDFEWPKIDCTVSESDLLPPILGFV